MVSISIRLKYDTLYVLLLIGICILSGCQNDIPIHDETPIKSINFQGFSSEEFNHMAEKYNEETTLAFQDNNLGNETVLNKDILNFISIGFTKQQIKDFTLQEYNLFSNKQGVLLGTKRELYKLQLIKNELMLVEGTEEEYNEQLNKKINPGLYYDCIESRLVCSNSQHFNNSGLLEISTSISRLNFSDTYAVISSFEWIEPPKEQFTDIFGLLVSDSMIIDYQSIFSRVNFIGEAPQYKNSQYKSTSNGYIHIVESKNKILKNAYSYAEIVPSNTQLKMFELSTGYIHLLESIPSIDLQYSEKQLLLNGDYKSNSYNTPFIRVFIK
ncbi:hypothetical protein ACFSCX_05985 [Bacillus salitolerans]|uniref:Lipoprotein n=1 Tax=Bacillus salitolerans TaxID=1437434 RepID=A0ABW4LLQ5_9BACI